MSTRHAAGGMGVARDVSSVEISFGDRARFTQRLPRYPLLQKEITVSDDVRINDEGRERAARAAAETATEAQGDGAPRPDAGESAATDSALSNVQRRAR